MYPHFWLRASPQELGEHTQPHQLHKVQLGKARGPELALPGTDICIDIPRYRHRCTLCRVMCDPRVHRKVGKRGRVTHLLNDVSGAVDEANPWGITISPHISKLEPMAFYATASQVYKRAFEGPFLVKGMKGISLHEVVPTIHMTLDLAHLLKQVVDVLISDVAKCFDVIAHDMHPLVGSHIGLGTGDHNFAHTDTL